MGKHWNEAYFKLCHIENFSGWSWRLFILSGYWAFSGKIWHTCICLWYNHYSIFDKTWDLFVFERNDDSVYAISINVKCKLHICIIFLQKLLWTKVNCSKPTVLKISLRIWEFFLLSDYYNWVELLLLWLLC